MSMRESLKDFSFRTLTAVHRALLRRSGGRLGGRLFGMRTVELHTIGRKSGKRRSTMLTAPIYSDDRIVLIASKGGDDRHPDWYRNLVVNPDVEVTPAGGETRRLRARTASAEEKAELWPTIVRAYRGYGTYQRRSQRDIPVVICEPR